MASKNAQDENTRNQAITKKMARQIRKTRSQLKTLAELNRDLAYANDTLKSELDQILESKAWQITRPLRNLHAVLFAAIHQKGGKSIQAAEETSTEPTQLILTPMAGVNPPLLDATVSFIIPTYNADGDLDELLPALLEQKGFVGVEVVTVDSGSEDGTPQKAEELGARVVSILKEDFTHSHSRNVGAQNAHGDYFVFTTQDALPTGPWWARRLLEPVANGTVAAASCIEKEKPGAELYAKLCIWGHHAVFMGLDGTDRIGTLPENETYDSMQKNANLNDIACAIRRDVFLQFHYRRDYAEDLELGIRMLRAGYSLGFLSSEQVLHSHRRKPYYYMKRAYVGQISTYTMLPDMPLAEINKPGLFARVLNGYGQFNMIKGWVDELPSDAVPLDEFDTHMDDFFVMAEFFEYKEPPAPSGDSELDELLNQVWRLAECELYPPTGLVDSLQHYYTNYISAFLRRTQQTVTRADRLEVVDCLLKHYAVHVGIVFFNYIRQGLPQDEPLAGIAKKFQSGV